MAFAQLKTSVDLALRSVLPTKVRFEHVWVKNGAPTNDSDLAQANGELCFDTTNSDVYIASNVTAITLTSTTLPNGVVQTTSATRATTTWTKIVD